MKFRKIELWVVTAVYAVHVYIMVTSILRRMNHLPYVEIMKKQFAEEGFTIIAYATALYLAFIFLNKSVIPRFYPGHSKIVLH